MNQQKNIHAWFPKQAKSQLIAQGSWDWLIGSNQNMQEDRANWSTNSLPADINRILLERADVHHPHRFRIRFSKDNETEVDWAQLSTQLANHIQAGQNVLVDMNLLSFDSLLYLLPALLELDLEKLGCIYAIPNNYSFNEHAMTDQLLHPIEQPKAYVALSSDANRKDARHLVFLGFDLARAWKFIDKYDWKYDHLYVSLGDPSLVENGRARALEAAQPWVGSFQRDFLDHLAALPAHDPNATAQWCYQHWEKCKWLDIVPLGPKPMNLGILWFYFGLSEKDRGRVRLLYDFPMQQKPRSQGIQKIYYYDCGCLLA